MRVECEEVEFACDEKQDRSHGFEASVSACLALGGLKQSVDGFDEAVGLYASREGRREFFGQASENAAG